MYYLGIDGGGTKTVAVVTDEKGRIITTVSGDTINFYSVGYENARKNLSELMNKITAETEICSFSGARLLTVKQIMKQQKDSATA